MAPMAEYNEKLEIVTEEVVICKLLTSNDLKVRKRGISSLKKWFRNIGLKKGVGEDDFNRIWNGLFYFVWMSDKPLVQEEAAECISGMIQILDNYQASMYYIRGFFSSLVKQWDRVSHHRSAKFLMFVRRFLRQIITLLKNHEWDIEKLELFSKELYSAIQILPYGLALHLNEIFNEEVAKVSKGKIPTDALVVLYKGYVECIVNLRPSMQVINSIQSNVFGGLVRQLKLYIKQKALTDGCDNENNTESTGSGDEEVNTSDLDPRPGGVDVFLPYIEFDEHVFVKFIEQYTSNSGIPLKAKNILNQIIAMVASISKLRTSVTDTDKLIREMHINPKKRKKPQESMSKLIKRSCYKLEEEDENEAESDERVLRKLRTMTDLIQIPAGKSTFTVAQAKPKSNETKRSSISNDWVVTETPEKPSTPKKAKLSGSKTDWVVEEATPKDNEKLNNKTVKKSPVSVSEKSPSVTRNGDNNNDDGHVSDSEIEVIDSTSVVKKSVSLNRYEEYDEADIHLEIDDENEKSSASLSDKPIVTREDEIKEDEEVINDENVSFDDKRAKSIEKVENNADSVIDDGKKSKNKSPKKSLSISFSENPIVTYYEDDSKKAAEIGDAKTEIVVPASVVKAHPNLMRKDRDYVVVDFQPEVVDDEVSHESDDRESVSQEPEKVTRTLRSRKVESTPVPVSTPDPKRTRKPREKKGESAVQRKSTRIAEKQKKVLFKLEENTYQDVPSYKKVLKSKPASPFDSSKLPNTGILKPFAVTSPINPFYFANGDRKLKRKRN